MGSTRPKTDGRQLRWEKHNRERRRALIDAAVEVLEQHPPGEEFHVQEVAERAGVHRTVVYRHFQDRVDLDLAVQREICARAAALVVPAVSLDGTPRQIVHRVVDTYVRWAVAHPALTQFVERELPGAATKPLDETLQQMAVQVEQIIEVFLALVDRPLSESDRDALDPWVFGLIGGGFEAVRRWTSRDRLTPRLETFVGLVTDVAWYQIEGLARSRGVPLPDVPVEELVARMATGDAADWEP